LAAQGSPEYPELAVSAREQAVAAQLLPAGRPWVQPDGRGTDGGERSRLISESIRTPTGTWSPAYTSSCSTENVASVAAVIPKRPSVSDAATPSDERCSTATTAANCPTVSTTHAIEPPSVGPDDGDRGTGALSGIPITPDPRGGYRVDALELDLHSSTFTASLEPRNRHLTPLESDARAVSRR
jgi:hypothetical protein